jgi:hypothetical protein
MIRFARFSVHRERQHLQDPVELEGAKKGLSAEFSIKCACGDLIGPYVSQLREECLTESPAQGLH